jgi:hypothetical protein
MRELISLLEAEEQDMWFKQVGAVLQNQQWKY